MLCRGACTNLAPSCALHQLSRRPRAPSHLTFGYQRAKLLGGFANGVFLVAVGVSIVCQSIERFIDVRGKKPSVQATEVRCCADAYDTVIEDPVLVLIIGGIGFFVYTVSGLIHHGGCNWSIVTHITSTSSLTVNLSAAKSTAMDIAMETTMMATLPSRSTS